MIWTIVITAALLAVAVGVWLRLCDASRQPGQHRGSGRARRRDPDDQIRENHEEPPEQPHPHGAPRSSAGKGRRRQRQGALSYVWAMMQP